MATSERLAVNFVSKQVCSGGKIVMSSAGEAYSVCRRGPNRKFRMRTDNARPNRRPTAACAACLCGAIAHHDGGGGARAAEWSGRECAVGPRLDELLAFMARVL